MKVVKQLVKPELGNSHSGNPRTPDPATLHFQDLRHRLSNRFTPANDLRHRLSALPNFLVHAQPRLAPNLAITPLSNPHSLAPSHGDLPNLVSCASLPLAGTGGEEQGNEPFEQEQPDDVDPDKHGGRKPAEPNHGSDTATTAKPRSYLDLPRAEDAAD